MLTKSALIILLQPKDWIMTI